jgi:DNA-binding CsgD family transcriptional regulator
MRRIDDRVLVELLESIYAFELDDSAWLQGVLAATTVLCGPENSYVGYFYDASDAAAFEVWNVRTVGPWQEIVESFRMWRESVTPQLVNRTFRRLRVGSTRRTGMPTAGPMLEQRAYAGWGDIFNVNGLDPSGIGCVLTIGTREHEIATSPEQLEVFTRLSSHLATAFRCRRRAGITKTPGSRDRAPDRSATEAILDAQGRFVHAEGEAAKRAARDRIRTASASIAALRARRERSGRGPLEAWRPLVGARWTLVDHFQRDGTRYVVARENLSPAENLDMLTERERQVVLQAALGSTNKEVAYALGISDSTVRVLLARAAWKVGARSREELLSHPFLREIRADGTEH